MENWVVTLIENVITSWIMLCVWLSVATFVGMVAFRLKIYGLLILVGGMVPNIIFNAYRSFFVWTSITPEAILYSRLADVTLAITLFASIKRMYKTWKDGKDELSRLPLG